MNKVKTIAAKWKTLFHLTHWIVDVSLSKSREGSSADISVIKKALYARIRVDANYALRNPKSVENSVIHEMIHLFLFPLMDWMERISKLLPEKMEKLAMDEFKERQEEIIIKLSKLLTDLEAGKLQKSDKND